MALLGIDVGSTGCKCMIFSADGGVLARRYTEYDRPAGSSLLDGMRIWELLAEMLPGAAAEAGEKVTAVAVASIGEAIAPVGRDGIPLHPFMQSTCALGNKYLPGLCERVGERIQAVTGLNPLARYSLSKLKYLHTEQPDIFQAAWKFMMLEDFIVLRLCGQAANDFSQATRTAAFDLTKRRYDEEILAAAGLDSSQLSEVFPTGTVVGEITGAMAARLGLLSGVSVVLAGHDTIPESLSAGLFTTGVASVGCGTFEAVSVLIPENPGPNPALLANNFSREPYPIPGYEFVSGVNPNAGGLVKWFREEFASGECLVAAQTGDNPYRLLVTVHIYPTRISHSKSASRNFRLKLSPCAILSSWGNHSTNPSLKPY